MAFWGVEVKPNKPYSHRFDSTRGRLRVSQATLGNGTSSNKCSLQCTVPAKTPVLLCSLFPDKSESCSLNLQFDHHDNDVIFSVIGPRSIHIAGYYLLPKSAPFQHGDDDTDSYGEDIGESDMSTDFDADEDDNYEDDFIDDGDLDASSASPSPSIETLEISDDEKLLYVKGGRKRLNKKYQVSDSDGDSKKEAILGGGRSIFLSDSEDEDALPISSLSKDKDEKAQVQEKCDKIATNKSMKSEFVSDQVIGAKRKLPYVQEGETESEFEKGGEENVGKRKKKKKKKEKKVTSNEEEKADDCLPSSDNRGSEVEKAVESHLGGEENVDRTKKKKKKKRKEEEEKKVTSNEEEKTVEIESSSSNNNRNVDEEAEEDGNERKKKKKKKKKTTKSEDIEVEKAGKKISSPIGK